MLNKICIFQIFLYLFISPLARIGQGFDEVSYRFDFAVLFLVIFMVAGAVSRTKSRSPVAVATPLLLSLPGSAILTGWSVLYSILSLKHGLIDRRIGTHEAALLFAEIPVADLVVFRVFELLFPFIVAYLLTRMIRFRLSVPDYILALGVTGALLLSGLAFSRSQAFFLLACSAIILQNSLSRSQFRWLLVLAGAAGVLMFFLVSVYRLNLIPDESLTNYFSDEILKRLDGLELISRLVEIHGYSAMGINPSSVAAPLLASIPFLPAALELKASALTTIKSHILAFEFGSMQGDTNSFVIVDVYYWGGIIFLSLSAAFLGAAVRKVDQGILVSKGIAKNALFIAMAGNLIYMERELISILIGIVRDFAIYAFMLFLVCKRPLHQRMTMTPDKPQRHL